MTPPKFYYTWWDKDGTAMQVNCETDEGSSLYRWTAEEWDTLPEIVERNKTMHLWVGALQGPASGRWWGYTDPEEFLHEGRLWGIIPE